MKRLLNILFIIGLILIVNWLLGRIVFLSFAIREISIDFVLVSALALVAVLAKLSNLISAIFLILIIILIRLQIQKKILIDPRKKILFWSACLILGGLLLFTRNLYAKKILDRPISEICKRIYYSRALWDTAKWLGITSTQYPSDNWVVQEMIAEIKPDFIVETGTSNGGTILFYAIALQKVNPNGKVITVDIESQIEEAKKFKIFQERIEFIIGDSVSAEVVNTIGERVKNSKVLVILDSLHTKEHVLKELNLYSKFVSLNSYIIVQDTYWGRHKDCIRFVKSGGPRDAVELFLKNNNDFKIDLSKERYFVTQYPSGFLKRIK